LRSSNNCKLKLTVELFSMKCPYEIFSNELSCLEYQKHSIWSGLDSGFMLPKAE